MELTGGQWAQLLIAVSSIVVAFVFMYAAPLRMVVIPLVIMIPFQPIESRFGSLNIMATYAVAIAMVLRGQVRNLPLLRWIIFIIFAYALSLSMAPKAGFREQITYLILIGSDFLIFYISYNYFKYHASTETFFKVLTAIAVLVIIYCFIQLIVGVGTGPVGSGELSMNVARSDARLSGPFKMVGVTAEYLVLQIMILGYLLMNATGDRKYQLIYMVLIAATLAFLVATGNRGGIIVLVLSGLVFLYLFRGQLGKGRILGALIAMGLAFTISSALVISYSDFDKLFTRLAETKLKEGVPDSRHKIWPLTWSRIKEKPILGHGPRLKFEEQVYRARNGPEPMAYPHSLYLFLLYTLGATGLIAYLLFFLQIVLALKRSNKLQAHDELSAGLPRLGMVLMLIFLVDQAKVEFLRANISDYQHYIFMLWGGLLAVIENSRHKHQGVIAGSGNNRSGMLNNQRSDARVVS